MPVPLMLHSGLAMLAEVVPFLAETQCTQILGLMNCERLCLHLGFGGLLDHDQIEFYFSHDWVKGVYSVVEGNSENGWVRKQSKAGTTNERREPTICDHNSLLFGQVDPHTTEKAPNAQTRAHLIG